MTKQLGIKIFAGLLASSAMTFAFTTGVHAHGHGGGHSSSGGIVPVHGSPPLNGGILVTHGNLHLPPPPVNIVRDHRPGAYFNWYCRHNPLACAPGGVLGGTPAIPPYGGLPQGGTVRDHRH